MNATYAIAYTDSSQNDLFLLFCFDVHCREGTRFNTTLSTSKGTISYPQVSVDYENRPIIAFFKNSTSLIVIHCDYWKCTSGNYREVTVSKNNEYITNSMQLSLQPYGDSQVVAYSIVTNNISSGYAGLGYVYCPAFDCAISQSSVLDENDSPSKFTAHFSWLVFIISVSVIVYACIFAVFLMCKYVDPSAFISTYIRNAYLQQVSLDHRIRPMSYWIFFATLICTAMCVVPWFAYFNFNISLYEKMILPPFAPVLLSLIFVIILHQNTNSYLRLSLAMMSLAYFAACIGLCYSFTCVWNLSSDNCQVADLSGLRIVIIVKRLFLCFVLS